MKAITEQFIGKQNTIVRIYYIRVSLNIYNEHGKYSSTTQEAYSHCIILGHKLPIVNLDRIVCSPTNCKELWNNILQYTKSDVTYFLIKLPDNENKEAIRSFCMSVIKERPEWDIEILDDKSPNWTNTKTV